MNTQPEKHFNKLLLIPIIAGALVILFILFTLITTPLFMVIPSRHEEAENYMEMHTQATYIEEPDFHGWFVDRPDTDKVLLFMGGIRMCSAEGARGYTMANAFADYDLAVVDFPGYGRNTEHPLIPQSELMKETAENAANYWLERSPYTAVLGYSMGTGPATYAASVCPVDKLMLIAPYASSLDLYNSRIDIFHGLMECLLLYNMDTAAYAAHVTCPVLIVMTIDDLTVPNYTTERLAGAFPSQPSKVDITGVLHGALWLDTQTIKSIEQFLK